MNLQHKGVCNKVNIKCKENKCPTIYDPVCGNNNITYLNSCQMECIF